MVWVDNPTQSAGAVSSRVIKEDDLYAWRERVWRFRRGWARLGQGTKILLFGAGDIAAGAPAAVAVALMLSTVWLCRRLLLLRLLLNTIIAIHRIFVRDVWRRLVWLVRVGWAPLGVGILVICGILIVTPALEVLVTAASREIADDIQDFDQHERRDNADSTRSEAHEAPERIEVPPLRLDASVLVERALVAASVVIGGLAVAVSLFWLVTYVGFMVWQTLRGLWRLCVSVLRGIANAGRAAVATTSSGVHAADRALDSFADAVRDFFIELFSGIKYLIQTLLLGVYRGARILLRAAIIILWRLLLLVVRGVIALARLVWAHVFRIFALTGSIAALSVSYWALRSAQAGRPFPQAFADIAGPTAAVVMTAFVVLSVLALLAAIALAIRHAPPRLLRTAGLVALVLLLLAPTPFIAIWLVSLGFVQSSIDAIQAGVSTVADNSDAILSALTIAMGAVVASAIIAALAFAAWRAARHVPRRMLGHAAAGLIVVLAAVTALIAFARAVTSDAAARAWRMATNGVDAGASVVWTWIVFIVPWALSAVAAAFGLVIGVLLLRQLQRWLRRVPTVAWRRAGLGAAALALVAGFGVLGLLLWRSGAPQSVYLATLERVRSIQSSERQTGAFEINDASLELEATDPAFPPERAQSTEPEPLEIAEAQPTTPAMIESEPAGRDASSTDEQTVDLGMPNTIAVYPVGALHWRFGSAELVGDGLTAFQRIGEWDVGAFSSLCEFDALLAVGVASSEGAPATNQQLAYCRAEALALRAQEAIEGCRANGPTMFVASLGPHTSNTASPDQRRLILLGAAWDSASVQRVDVASTMRQLGRPIVASGVDPADYAHFTVRPLDLTDPTIQCRDFAP